MAVYAPPADDSAVSDLQERFRGTLLRPDDRGYDVPEIDVPLLVCAGAGETRGPIAAVKHVADLVSRISSQAPRSNASKTAATVPRSRNRSDSFRW